MVLPKPYALFWLGQCDQQVASYFSEPSMARSRD